MLDLEDAHEGLSVSYTHLDVYKRQITSLAGQGLAPEDAAKAGVFVHGLSGDLAADKLGEYGLVASDIADYVPFALKELTE